LTVVGHFLFPSFFFPSFPPPINFLFFPSRCSDVRPGDSGRDCGGRGARTLTSLFSPSPILVLFSSFAGEAPFPFFSFIDLSPSPLSKLSIATWSGLEKKYATCFSFLSFFYRPFSARREQAGSRPGVAVDTAAFPSPLSASPFFFFMSSPLFLPSCRHHSSRLCHGLFDIVAPP